MHATQAAAQIARAYGVKVAFDPNYRPRLWTDRGGLAAATEAFDALLPLVDILLPAIRTISSCFDAAAALEAHPGLELAIKCGADGSLLMLRKARNASLPCLPTWWTPPAAGDAWNGAYLLHRLRGLDPAQAAALANGVAAAKLAHRGAIPPTAFIQ